MSMGSNRIIIELYESHMHLSKQDFRLLFGEGAKLEAEKRLSQPGSFISKQRLKVEGPNGKIISLPVYGPLRGKTQIEIYKDEMEELGLKLPGTGIVTIHSEQGKLVFEGGVTVAACQLHMPPEDASPYHLSSLGKVSVALCECEDVVLKDIAVKISHMYVTRLHLPAKEAAKYGIQDGEQCTLVEEMKG